MNRTILIPALPAATAERDRVGVEDVDKAPEYSDSGQGILIHMISMGFVAVYMRRPSDVFRGDWNNRDQQDCSRQG